MVYIILNIFLKAYSENIAEGIKYCFSFHLNLSIKGGFYIPTTSQIIKFQSASPLGTHKNLELLTFTYKAVNVCALEVKKCNKISFHFQHKTNDNFIKKFLRAHIHLWLKTHVLKLYDNDYLKFHYHNFDLKSSTLF